MGLKNYTHQDGLETCNAVGDKAMILCRGDQETTHTLPHYLPLDSPSLFKIQRLPNTTLHSCNFGTSN